MIWDSTSPVSDCRNRSENITKPCDHTGSKLSIQYAQKIWEHLSKRNGKGGQRQREEHNWDTGHREANPTSTIFCNQQWISIQRKVQMNYQSMLNSKLPPQAEVTYQKVSQTLCWKKKDQQRFIQCTLHSLTFQLAVEVWTSCLAVDDGGGQLDDLSAHR